MADVTTCVVRHLRADATIDGLCGDRIYFEPPVPVEGGSITVPDITVTAEPGFEGDHKITARWRIRFSTRADRKSRSDLYPIEDRLRVLFHDATNYTLGSSTTVYCVISERLQAPDQRHDEATGFWTSETVYEFVVLDAI